jgi:Aminoglycoside-2''-adenylyltransferase
VTPTAASAAQLVTLGWLGEALGRRGIAHWVFGGWAVDLHLGRTSREHADIDVAVWASDRPVLDTLLLDDGWVRTPDPDEDGYTAYQRGPVRLEVAFLARDEDGTVYTPVVEGRGSWPPGSFGEEEGEVDGVRARVVGRGSLVEDKSGPRDDPTAAAKDRADVAALVGTPDPVQDRSGGSMVSPGGTPCASRRS